MALSGFPLVPLLCAVLLMAAEPPKPSIPRTTAELEQAIRKVLADTKTPGAGVSIVCRDRVLWTAGIGKADVAKGIDVTPDTLFRIGSVSKTFVSLSILKLQEQGRLHVTDTVRSLAPEIAFTNPWESTDPVRIVNLLEHTTGFDDLHSSEYANNDPTPITLRAGLDFHPHSRTSRWRPGTCFSYCNSGPAFAAYIVEKISGQRFEDYVRENFFRPLRMGTADYFLTPAVEQKLTKLYQPDGKTPYRYWHILMRPSGAINASAREMANSVQFFLNRGSFAGTQLVQPASIERMERPASTLAARAGMGCGYGLSNYVTIADGFVYHGHDGGVEGGLTQLAYLPEQGLGYVFFINSGNGDAFGQIAKLVRDYLTRDLPKPSLPPAAAMNIAAVRPFLGYVEPVTPRQEMMRFVERILGVRRFNLDQGKLTVSRIIGAKKKTYVAVADNLFRDEKEPVATLALIPSSPDGPLWQMNGPTFRPVSAAAVWSEYGWGAASLLLMASAVLFALIWIPRKLLGKLRGVPCLSIRWVPLLSILCLACAVALFMVSEDDILQRFGNPTFWSVGFCVLTVAFALTAVAGLVLTLRARNSGVRRGIYAHALAVSLANTAVAGYLAYWGIIGYRSWL
jgi:CubicO group peptidase (beta-lactamase class C family)